MLLLQLCFCFIVFVTLIPGVLNPLACATHLRWHCSPHYPPHSTATPYSLLYTLLHSLQFLHSTIYNLHSTHTSLHYPTAGFVFSSIFIIFFYCCCWAPVTARDSPNYPCLIQLPTLLAYPFQYVSYLYTWDIQASYWSREQAFFVWGLSPMYSLTCSKQFFIKRRPCIGWTAPEELHRINQITFLISLWYLIDFPKSYYPKPDDRDKIRQIAEVCFFNVFPSYVLYLFVVLWCNLHITVTLNFETMSSNQGVWDRKPLVTEHLYKISSNKFLESVCLKYILIVNVTNDWGLFWHCSTIIRSIYCRNIEDCFSFRFVPGEALAKTPASQTAKKNPQKNNIAAIKVRLFCGSVNHHIWVQFNLRLNNSHQLLILFHNVYCQTDEHYVLKLACVSLPEKK